MDNKTLFGISGTVFAIVALVHLLRVIYSWEAVFNNWAFPVWASYVGLLLAGALAYLHFAAYRKKK